MIAVNTRTVLYPTSHRYIACIHSYCPCSRIANVRIPEPFFWGGGSVFFSLFSGLVDINLDRDPNYVRICVHGSLLSNCTNVVLAQISGNFYQLMDFSYSTTPSPKTVINR